VSKLQTPLQLSPAEELKALCKGKLTGPSQSPKGSLAIADRNLSPDRGQHLETEAQIFRCRTKRKMNASALRGCIGAVLSLMAGINRQNVKTCKA